MKYRILLLISGLTFITLFFVFTFLVRSDALRQFDFNMTVKVQDNIPEKGYRYLELIGEFPRFEIITVFLILMLLIFRQWWQTIAIVGIYGVAHVLELVGKLILTQPPPPFMFYKLQNENNVWFPSNYVAQGNSYPSGHSMRAFFVAVLIGAFIYSSKKIPIMIRIGIISGILILAGLVAIAKVAMGQHWTTDVIAGAFMGVGGALVSASLLFFTLNNSQIKKVSK